MTFKDCNIFTHREIRDGIAYTDHPETKLIELSVAEARVQELEAIIDHTFLIGKATSNQIKAEGIEEMCEKKYAWFTAQQIIWMERYANKLREGADGNT